MGVTKHGGTYSFSDFDDSFVGFTDSGGGGIVTITTTADRFPDGCLWTTVGDGCHMTGGFLRGHL